MRYRLRTLLIAVAIIPPVVAPLGVWAWREYLAWQNTRPDVQVLQPGYLGAILDDDEVPGCLQVKLSGAISKFCVPRLGQLPTATSQRKQVPIKFDARGDAASVSPACLQRIRSTQASARTPHSPSVGDFRPERALPVWTLRECEGQFSFNRESIHFR